MSLVTVNPYTGNVIKNYEEISNEELNEKIEIAHRSFLEWSRKSFSERKVLMKKVVSLLRSNKEEYANIITMEMGKPITQAIAEIEKCAWVCDYYADEAERYLQPRFVETEMSKSKVCYKPFGVIFSIMPWNFPFWQVFRFLAPNLMAGNVGMLSHAPISTGASLAIESIFKKAGFPEGVFTSLLIDIPQSAKVIAHKHITGVTLTGSSGAGKAVGAEAAKNLKKCVLELGGSDPYLILEDADVQNAAEICVTARLANAGQICISPKRLIAVEAIYDEFVAAVTKQVKKYAPGNPMDADCNFGPMARKDLREELHKQVQDSIAAGATCILGGNKIEGEAYFYEPTLLVGLKPGMPAYDDELFGPVVSIIKAKDESDAIRIANDSIFGLGAAVFTQNIQRGEDIATNELNAGTCVVNTYVGSDPRLPFGGIKESGNGRECSSEGIQEFLNVKTVNIK